MLESIPKLKTLKQMYTHLTRMTLDEKAKSNELKVRLNLFMIFLILFDSHFFCNDLSALKAKISSCRRLLSQKIILPE